MKRNKVLLGLFAGLLTLAGGSVKAQNGGGFYEIGPDNVGGQVSSIVADWQDTMGTTLYAGAATGGLFMRSSNLETLLALYNRLEDDEAKAALLASNKEIWHHVPYVSNDREVTLPINCMVQTPDTMIYIGTGNDAYDYGTTYDRMSVKGKGIFRFNPKTYEFEIIPATDPALGTNFQAVHDLQYYYSDGVLYLFAATNAGLYRWRHVVGTNDWSQTPVAIFNGNVDQIVISRSRMTAFFSSGNQLWRIGDVTLGNNDIVNAPINISESNSAFGGTNSCIKLALSQYTSPMYLYAMVIGPAGYLDALYVTTDEQTWTTLTTVSNMPITNKYSSGKVCGAVAIDPANARRVVMAGTNVLIGEGFIEGSNYQWTTASASEYNLNYGSYMSTVFSSRSFVHSGIHQILPVRTYDADGNRYFAYYFATDGGVYYTKDSTESFNGFNNLNSGLNNVQVNALAVAPDGTIISGANANACPVIEAQLDHNVANGGAMQQPISWYNDGTLTLNREANIILRDNGGAVAASAFQQVNPTPRRTIFTSANSGTIGRTYADYLDYTNTTTWTYGQNFLTDAVVNGPEIGSLYLWETNDTNVAFNDSIKATVDTLGYIYRKVNGEWKQIWINNPDSTGTMARGSKFQIKRGDKAIFYSRANADYPFEYIYKKNALASDTVKVKSPVQSRMLLIADQFIGMGSGEANARSVFFSWAPNDFTKVWDAVETDANKFHLVSPVYRVQRIEGSATEHVYPRQAVFSRDGYTAFVSLYNSETHKSMLVRIKGFENVDYAKEHKNIGTEIDVDHSNITPLRIDTLMHSGNVEFDRPISNIAVDPRDGEDRLVLTFEDYSDAYANVAVVNNASTNYSINAMALDDRSLPAYTAIVEDSTGTIYVGTAAGVFTRVASSATWHPYTKISDVPVTSIYQQTRKFPVRHNLTHTGITANRYAFAKTKWSRAIYFGTYGRGIFMDMQYVTDFENEVVDSNDYNNVSIPTVHATGAGSLNLYPNPVVGEANVALNATVAGNAVLRVYDLNGRIVMDRNLGHVSEGEHLYTIDCTGMSKGMYLINVIISGHTATAKMMVR